MKYGTKYSRMDQVKIFKGYLPQILFSPFLNTLSHTIVQWRHAVIKSTSISMRVFRVFSTCRDLFFYSWNLEVTIINISPELVSVYIHNSYFTFFLAYFHQHIFFFFDRNQEATIERISLEMVFVFIHAIFFIFKWFLYS